MTGRKLRTVLPVILMLLCAACETAAPVQRSSSPATQVEYDRQAPISLFADDATVLSDADIDRILRFHYVPPAQARIAVLALGQEVWFGYSDELARTGADVRSEFAHQLKTAATVTEVSFLPTLLVPTKRSVGLFREAAARYQADLLIVYQSSCRTYEKSRLFAASTSKSFCNVEAAILDVRTGLVPFATAATKDLTVSKNPEDLNIYETMRKAELGAIREALVKIGTEISAYLTRR